MEVKGLFQKDETIGKVNEVQLGLIATSTLDVVIETSLVSTVETKQVRKVDLNWTCFSIHTITERYGIVPLLFTRERNGTISYRSNFWFTFPYRPISVPVWNGPLDFFPFPCERNPTLYHFLERTKVER